MRNPSWARLLGRACQLSDIDFPLIGTFHCTEVFVPKSRITSVAFCCALVTAVSKKQSSKSFDIFICC